MYWEVTEVTRAAAMPTEEVGPRFVLHRHEDEGGVHHDLRLESGNCLVGFRVAGDALEAGCWATEKMPHPKRWLGSDGEAQRVLAGTYGWRTAGPGRRTLRLYGADATMTLCFERCAAPGVATVRALAQQARALQVDVARLGDLAADGLAARRNAIARFCGLSRALDGDAFDEAGWRSLLSGQTLRQVGERLASVEARYDRAHPPAPTSRPEPLDADRDGSDDRARRAMKILGMK